MVVSGIWSLYHQLGSSWNICKTSTLDIFVSRNRKAFIGEIFIDDESSGTLRFPFSGSLYRREIRWWLAGLEYRGDVDEHGVRIHSGQIYCIGSSPARDGIFGAFRAVRVADHAGKVKSTLQAGCRIGISHMWARCKVTDYMVDALDRYGASIETLRAWQSREASVADVFICAQPLLPPHIRSPLIRQMLSILTAAGASERWYSAVSLLDQCARCCAGDNFIDSLPLTGMAILHLVQSFDSARERVPFSAYAEYALSVAQWLHGMGYIADAPARFTAQQVREHEKFLLCKLHGRLPLPTARDWLLVFFKRLEVLTHNQYASHLTHAWCRCDVFVKMCTLMLDTTDPCFPPSRIARGLLVHSLVAVRLLPVSILQPSCVDSIDWQILFAAGQPEGSGAASSCMLEMDSLSIFLQQVQTSVGVDFTMLTEDSIHMAIFMRDAFHVLRAWDHICQVRRVQQINL